MDPIFWSILMLVAGLLLIMLEVFVPSGGVLGFLAVTTLVSSISMAFYHRGIETGLLFIVIAGVAVPAALATAFKYWPHTTMGRRVLLGVPTEDEVMPNTPQLRALRSLVGKIGVAKSLMLPSGAVLVAGQTCDALSEGEPIETGQHVRVIEVRGNRVVVAATDDAPPAEVTVEKTDDILSQPLESLGIDDDPLA